MIMMKIGKIDMITAAVRVVTTTKNTQIILTGIIVGINLKTTADIGSMTEWKQIRRRLTSGPVQGKLTGTGIREIEIV